MQSSVFQNGCCLLSSGLGLASRGEIVKAVMGMDGGPNDDTKRGETRQPTLWEKYCLWNRCVSCVFVKHCHSDIILLIKPRKANSNAIFLFPEWLLLTFVSPLQVCVQPLPGPLQHDYCDQRNCFLSAWLSSLEGWSTVLLFDDALASQIGTLHSASASTKSSAKQSTVGLSDKPFITANLQPSLSTKRLHFHVNKSTIQVCSATGAAKVSASKMIYFFCRSPSKSLTISSKGREKNAVRPSGT